MSIVEPSVNSSRSAGPVVPVELSSVDRDTSKTAMSQPEPCQSEHHGHCEPRYASWQAAVKDAVRDPDELCRLVNLPPRYASSAVEAARDFPVFAPRGYIARMRPGDARDPLLRQVLPLEDELAARPGFGPDPVGDRAATRSPGLLHKYRSRILMVTTGACAVHCRYCFRREFPYGEQHAGRQAFAESLAAIITDGVGVGVLTCADPSAYANRACRLMDGYSLEVLLGAPGRTRAWAVAEVSAALAADLRA